MWKAGSYMDMQKKIPSRGQVFKESEESKESES